MGPALPPVVTNPGNQTSAVGAIVNLPISASDPNGNTLSYSATGCRRDIDQGRHRGRHWHAEHGGHLERDRDGE